MASAWSGARAHPEAVTALETVRLTFCAFAQGRLTISGKDARIGEQKVYFKVQAFLTDTQCEIKFIILIHRGEKRRDTAKAG